MYNKAFYSCNQLHFKISWRVCPCSIHFCSRLIYADKARRLPLNVLNSERASDMNKNIRLERKHSSLLCQVVKCFKEEAPGETDKHHHEEEIWNPKINFIKLFFIFLLIVRCDKLDRLMLTSFLGKSNIWE